MQKLGLAEWIDCLQNLIKLTNWLMFLSWITGVLYHLIVIYFILVLAVNKNKKTSRASYRVKTVTSS